MCDIWLWISAAKIMQNLSKLFENKVHSVYQVYFDECFFIEFTTFDSVSSVVAAFESVIISTLKRGLKKKKKKKIEIYLDCHSIAALGGG